MTVTAHLSAIPAGPRPDAALMEIGRRLGLSETDFILYGRQP